MSRPIGYSSLAILAAMLLVCASQPSAAQAPAVQAPAGTLPGSVAFIRDGNLSVLDLQSGTEARLSADGDDSAPRWSPSGRWIAFFKGFSEGQGELWVAAADGSQAHSVATAATDFAWSPAADVLDFISAGALLAENADGSDERTLASAADRSYGNGAGGFAWSADGAWIAFARTDLVAPAEAGQTGGRLPSIWRVRADGSDASEVVRADGPESYGLVLAGWSGDGDEILYWTDAAFSASLLADGAPLYAVPAAGGTPAKLADVTLAYRDFVVPDPSPSSRIAVVEGGLRMTWLGKLLEVLTPATGGGVALTGPEVAVSSPAWSPDGRSLAYVSMPADSGNFSGGADALAALAQRRIVVADPTGQSPPRQLTDDPEYRDESPRRSADGSAILFARFDRQANVSLWLVPAAGGAPTELVDGLSPAPLADLPIVTAPLGE